MTTGPAVFQLIVQSFRGSGRRPNTHQRPFGVFDTAPTAAAEVPSRSSQRIGLDEGSQPVPWGEVLPAVAQEGIAFVMQTGIGIDHHARGGCVVSASRSWRSAWSVP